MTMKKLKTFLSILFMFLVVHFNYGQSNLQMEDIQDKLSLPIPNQLNLHVLPANPTLSKNTIDSIPGSTLPKGFQVDPELNIVDFNLGEVTQYPMPIKALGGNHTMQIHIPDSTLHYTLQIKELGKVFDKNRK